MNVSMLHLLLGGLLLASAARQRVAAATYDYPAPSPATYTLPVIQKAADGVLLDTEGKTVALSALTRGRVTVMSFIYTRCADATACPHATGVLRELHRVSSEEPDIAESLRLVSMSFDPIHDPPSRMALYSGVASRFSRAAPWHFVTARTPEELAPILTAYGQAVDPKENPTDPTGPLNHTLRVFLIDREARIRNIYSSATLDPRLILADIRTLMIEESRPGTALSAKERPAPGLSPQ